MPQITYLHDDGSRESIDVAPGANVMRTAIENACATISSGMSDSRACETTSPASIKWHN